MQLHSALMAVCLCLRLVSPGEPVSGEESRKLSCTHIETSFLSIGKVTKLPGSDSETQVIALSAEAVTFQLPSGEEVTLPCQTNGSFWACTDGDLTFTAVPEDGRTVIGHPGRDGRLLEILECRLADGENTETRQ